MSIPVKMGSEEDNWREMAFRNRMRAEEAEAEVERLRAALEEIRLHTEGQVSQYARARWAVARIAVEALTPGEERPA